MFDDPADAVVLQRLRPVERRSHVERRAEARATLIATAIDCLDQFGYGATTTLLVSSRSGITRGGMLHYYPSKAHLIVAVAEHVGQWQYEMHRNELLKLPRGGARLLALVGVTWKLALEPESSALLEIMSGVRRDPDLQTQIVPILENGFKRHRDAVVRMAADAGMKNPELVDPMAELLMANIQGLAVRCRSSMGAFDATTVIKLLDQNWRAAMSTALNGRP